MDEARGAFALDLEGLVVLTEAATGPYALTAAIAARAGARRVLCVARSSRHGSAADAVCATRFAAQALGVEDRLQPVCRDDARLAEADVVTNLGAMRPLDAALLARLRPGAAIALMWETWEHRPDELDLDACRRLGLPVLGTNERHPALRTLAYTGHLALKLLYELGLEGLGTRVALVGRGPLADEAAALLLACGALVTTLVPSELGGARAEHVLAGADVLVLAENIERAPLVGPGGRMGAMELAATSPAIAVAHLAGGADRDALVAAGLCCAPATFAAPPHLSVSTDFLGPRPLIALHTPGLVIGAALARRIRAGRSAGAAEADVLRSVPWAQAFGAGVPPRGLCLTLDVDWAPDCAIDAVAAMLVERRVKATWFVTHASPAIDRLREHPALFELGVHPNFLPGSTHGATPRAVLDHVMRLVPDALAVRAHCLVQSTPILDLVLEETPLRVESSTFVPGGAPRRPFVYRRAVASLVRVPYTWEDTFALAGHEPLSPPLEHTPLVLAFHPVHVALNSTGLGHYTALKHTVPRLSDATADEVARFVAEGRGVRSAFLDAVDAIARHGGGLTISEYAARERA